MPLVDDGRRFIEVRRPRQPPLEDQLLDAVGNHFFDTEAHRLVGGLGQVRRELVGFQADAFPLLVGPSRNHLPNLCGVRTDPMVDENGRQDAGRPGDQFRTRPTEPGHAKRLNLRVGRVFTRRRADVIDERPELGEQVQPQVIGGQGRTVPVIPVRPAGGRRPLLFECRPGPARVGRQP